MKGRLERAASGGFKKDQREEQDAERRRQNKKICGVWLNSSFKDKAKYTIKYNNGIFPLGPSGYIIVELNKSNLNRHYRQTQVLDLISLFLYMQ